MLSKCLRCEQVWDLDFDEESCTCTEEHFDYQIIPATIPPTIDPNHWYSPDSKVHPHPCLPDGGFDPEDEPTEAEYVQFMKAAIESKDLDW